MSNIRIYLLGLASAFMLTGCLKDLDQSPIDPDSLTSTDIAKNPESQLKTLAKLYGAFTLSGQQGPAGMPDVVGVDESVTQFSRGIFYLQEFSTDNAICSWGNDPGVLDFHNMNWTVSNPNIEGLYYRMAYIITLTNTFITDTTDEVMRSEARFLRAYAYLSMTDLFGAVPLLDKFTDKVTNADVKSRAEIFKFVEKELKDIEQTLPATSQYGRVNKVAAQALLSRLYLNAEVYASENRYADALEYSKKVLDSPYKLHTKYAELFMADNDTNGAQNENIFTLGYNGLYTQTWAGSSFLIHAAIGGDTMNASEYGVKGAWGGIRAVKEFIDRFEATEYNNGAPVKWKDDRAMFFTKGQSYDIDEEKDIPDFKKGYAVTKFSNVRSDGKPAAAIDQDMVDTDLALIRLGEIYLNYAEAALRTGDTTGALEKVNVLRERANATKLTNITLDDILAERSRELYWEGFRRTDLIRFNKFTEGSYLWRWKGGVKEGKAVESFRKLYPIPNNVVTASNGAIGQNEGY